MAVDRRRELKHSKGNDDVRFRCLVELHLHSVLFLIFESLTFALSRMSAWLLEVSYV